VSSNKYLISVLKKIADNYELPIISAPPKLCTDNAVMIAWMGWELMNAEQDVDITNKTAYGLKKIPLGSYVEGLTGFRTTDLKRVGTASQNLQMEVSQKKRLKRERRNF